MGGSKNAWRLTKQEIVIKVSPNKPIDYITMWARIVVTHVTSYDVSVGSVVLYPLGVTIDFWEEIASNCLGYHGRQCHGVPSFEYFIHNL